MSGDTTVAADRGWAGARGVVCYLVEVCDTGGMS